MRINKIRVAFVLSVLLVGLFSLSFISAQFSSSFVAKTPSSQFFGYGGSAFDSSMCREGQDFVLQVSPKGCTPSVVRSDLLEKQNVPVFCPISAIQLNPLIDVGVIDGMTINGEVSGGSVGGFYPARAALGRGDLEVNSPVLGNVGYAVIVLKQNKNESSMPDFVEGNLTARISYDIKEHFGVGKSTLYLPVMDDAEWNSGFNHYGFWEGLGYLRADSVGDDRATISIYAGQADSSKIHGGKITSRTISVGQTSSDIPLSGAAYCLAGLNLRLDDLEAADKTVRLNINGEFTEVKEGEKFLNNRCRIRKIESYGVVDKTVVTCDEDSKQNTFTLTFSPKVKLNISGLERDVGLGERLYEYNGSTVYLSYIGTRNDTLREEDLIIGLASVPGLGRNKLIDSEMESFGNFFNSAPNGDIVGMINGIKSVKDAGSVILKGIRTAADLSRRWLVDGILFESVSIVEGKSVFGNEVIVVGFAEPVDADISVSKSDLRENYDNAVDDYQRVIDSYSSDKYPDDAESTLGQDAFAGLIELNDGVGQKRKVAELCAEFKDAYPKLEILKICESEARLASSTLDVRDVTIQGRIYRISLDRVKLPGFEDFGAEVSVKMSDGRIDSFDLRKEISVVIDEKTGAYIQLLDVRDEISEQSIRIRTNVREGIWEGAGRILVGNDVEIIVKKGFPSSRGGYLITLDDVNLVRVAKVSVLPEIRDSGTTAEFPVKIGIEKRLIQLSPEKTRDIVNKLNETIEKWGNINDKLGRVVEVGNVACLSVGTYLTAKNFVLNLKGEGAARRLVMRGDGGWFKKCGENVVSSRELYACLLENSTAIEKSVDEVAEVIRVQDEAIKKLQEGITTSRFLEEDTVDTDKLVKEFVGGNYVSELRGNLGSVQTIKVNNIDVPVSEILGRVSADAMYMTQARDLQLNARLLKSGDSVVRAVAQKNVEKALVDIYVNGEESSIRETFATKYGFVESGLISTGKSVELPLTDVKIFGEVKNQFSLGTGVMVQDSSYVYPVKDSSTGKEYLLVLDNDFVVKDTYLVENRKLNIADMHSLNPLGLNPKFYDAGAYSNHYENPKLKYYESGQYKGFPAIVPFDVEEGWYAGVKSTLPVLGSIQSYDDSGRVSSFYLCNVGKNNKEEFFSGIGDDECVMINPGINAPYDNFPGLDSNEATRLTRTAISAIAKASRDYRAGVSGVRIVSPSGVETMIDVGESAVGTPDIRCQDFMSSTDCNLMFNICDPVVCPSSRCDLGGTYPVRDVAASGIFGSVALCLPNWPEVKVPVCLSGVHAGVDAYLSVLENYQDCLENSLETGQQIGICDELHSIYMCDFFWRQSMPFANSVIPSALGKIFGKQGTRGGGEYLSVPSAWDSASDSAEFFTKQYAANSFEAFKVRSTTGVGTEVCKNWVSLRAPDGGSLLSSITKPRSPAQYYGRFTETPFTTATVPPTSHYKVFYHIYAGDDVPAYYQVYLKSTGQAFFQDTSGQRVVASGFIPSGEYATCGTNPAYPCDFTAPSGFSELCIVVNGNEECGFSQVTTDYGVNYLADKYVADEVSRTDITSERVCVSGSVNVFSLNPTAGISDRIEPDLYNMGITRICATSNPGSATDSRADREGSRWVNVGYCGNPSVGCWLDTQSVSTAIKNTNVANEVVQDVAKDYLDVLKAEGGYLSDSEFAKTVEDIDSQSDFYGKINLIGENLGKVLENNKKGFLTLLRGNAYSNLVIRAYQLIVKSETETPAGESGGAEGTDGSGENLPILQRTPEDQAFIDEIIEEITSIGTKYPIFEFVDGRYFGGQSLFLTYSGDSWYWSLDKSEWFNSDTTSIFYPENALPNSGGQSSQKANLDTSEVLREIAISSSKSFASAEPDATSVTEQKVPGVSDENKNFFMTLKSQDYLSGLQIIIDKVKENKESSNGIFGAFSRDIVLKTENVEMDPSGIFIVKGAQFISPYSNSTYLSFKYFDSVEKWEWRSSEEYSFASVSDLSLNNLIKGLNEKNFIEGSALIFGAGVEGFNLDFVVKDSSSATISTCSTQEECQKVLGGEIVRIASEIKSQRISSDSELADEILKRDTGLSNFECLVLAVAYRESIGLNHCGNVEKGVVVDSVRNGDPLYCEGDINTVLKGDGGNSLGIMQINKGEHGEKLDFEGNVYFGINYLINGYDAETKKFVPTQTSYSGWTRALRNYNGWGSGGDNGYVENVLSSQSIGKLKELFPDVCNSDFS